MGLSDLPVLEQAIEEGDEYFDNGDFATAGKSEWYFKIVLPRPLVVTAKYSLTTDKALKLSQSQLFLETWHFFAHNSRTFWFPNTGETGLVSLLYCDHKPYVAL